YADPTDPEKLNPGPSRNSTTDHSRQFPTRQFTLLIAPPRLFRPNGNCSCDGGCNSLNRPFIFSTGNNGETPGLRVVPGRAKPFALSFHVPVVALPCFVDIGSAPFVTGERGSRAIFPSGVKVILNLVPEGVLAVKAWPVKKVA